MFHTFFELIIHEMPLKDAENYVREMRAVLYGGMDENYGAVMPYKFLPVS